jgi:hypothetical protein
VDLVLEGVNLTDELGGHRPRLDMPSRPRRVGQGRSGTLDARNRMCGKLGHLREQLVDRQDVRHDTDQSDQPGMEIVLGRLALGVREFWQLRCSAAGLEVILGQRHHPSSVGFSAC